MLDAGVQHGAERFQKFDAGIRQMLLRCSGHSQQLSDAIRDLLARAGAGVYLCGLSLLVHCASFISTVKTRFSSRALAGCQSAIVRGSPESRRRVPTSTISSSPFLNNPTSPLVAKGSSTRTS